MMEQAQDNLPAAKRSVRRNALELLRRIRSGEVRPEEVTRHERRVCVACLRLEGYTQEEIAEIFEVHRQTISRDVRALRKQAAHLVDEIDVRSVAGGLISWAEHIRAKALKEKDYQLAWRVQRELVSDLQGLGYLPRAPRQHDVRVTTFADLAKLAAEDAETAPKVEGETPLLPISNGASVEDAVGIAQPGDIGGEDE